ncbi:MAG: GNAT family N-acetyltransferase [Nanoarchaeota archaeon]|nr:GNAT family N-acetyltransferase [Nanoarchaeota archaeon]
MFKKIRLLRTCFPESWIRKLPLLLFPADTIKCDSKVVALCTTFRRRIILLCVDKDYRRKGLASQLIGRSNAVKTDTYLFNEEAINVWKKNGFVVEKIVNTPFGKKYILVKSSG